MARARRRARLTLAVGLGVCLYVTWPPARAGAQNRPQGDGASAISGSTSVEQRPRHVNRVYLGMWTTHLKGHVLALDSNWAMGVAYRGVFGATFMNSYGRRAFAGGIQRAIFSTGHKPVGFSLGYRLGLVTGYDRRLMAIARRTPVLPLAQPYASIEVQRMAFEVSYTFVVVSVATSYKF